MTPSARIPGLPVNVALRSRLGFDDDRYDARGRLVLATPREARELSARLSTLGGEPVTAGDLWGAAHIFTAWRIVLEAFEKTGPDFETTSAGALESVLGAEGRDRFLASVLEAFPGDSVRHGRKTPMEAAVDSGRSRTGRRETVRDWVFLRIASDNPAFAPFRALFDDAVIRLEDPDDAAWTALETAAAGMPSREPEDVPPLAFLQRPVLAAPASVRDQLLYILTRWASLLGDWAAGLLGALDLIEEETRPRFGGPGPARPLSLDDLDGEARFSDDHAWMPRVVLMAKNVLVWLDQLSRDYGYRIGTLDGIPDAELDRLAARGFNALWLIGLWERSQASRKIKRWMGNPEAAASAYSLFGYDIADELGGWAALHHLKSRAAARGIRLASDMVPNHVGIDSDWVRNHPERLLRTGSCPYPSYGFDSEDLSEDPGVGLWLENHYWDHTDAAVVFKRYDRRTGATDYVYHGNDGTTMPWNDTAQIDFLNPEAREAVIQDILHVARSFPLIRFDAAMVLASKHIRRLWYPAPGAGGAVPSRSEHALDDEAFHRALPREFWRDVVDRINAEIPGTLLLAEAFWMMEGYFVRALGMHRVYNSAFMNMLRDQKNGEYRDMIKETLAFDPGILQRFVNFMNNPDEETAVGQFGREDKYFAVCTLLATLPGLPMFGHGQVEGFTEKYGMEYVRAYSDERPDDHLVRRHEKEIFPLLMMRHVFAGSSGFRLFDLVDEHGDVNQNVYAFVNGTGHERALVAVNNAYERASGRIRDAVPFKEDGGGLRGESLLASLGFAEGGPLWILLRENNAGIWYLRHADDLRDNGLSLSLDGYGRQVFLSFETVREAPDGAWGRLAGELGGRGVPDPEAALKELRLRPFREALDLLAPAGSLAALADAIRTGRPEDLLPDESRFAETVRRLLLADAALRTVPPPDEAAIADRTAAVFAESALRLRGAAGLLSRPGRRIGRLLEERFGPSDGDEALLLAVWALLAPLSGLPGDRTRGETWEEWALDRWLAGNPDADGSARLARNAALAVRCEGWAAAGWRLLGLLSVPALRNAAGVNSWDDVLWYREEGLASVVRVGAMTALAAAPDGLSRRNLRRAARTLRRWHRAARGAAYRLDRLLALADR